MYSQLRVSALAIIGSVGLAGCAGGGLDVFGGAGSSDVTTSSVAQTQAQRVDPACGNLAVEIDALRREGVADKVDRAAAKTDDPIRPFGLLSRAWGFPFRSVIERAKLQRRPLRFVEGGVDGWYAPD